LDTSYQENPAPHPGRHPGAVLDDQRIRADMVHPGADRHVQRGGEVRRGLPRRSVDQIEVDVLEARRARLGRGLRRPSRGVPAVQHREHVRRGRLHAQRDPGEPGRPEPAQRVRGDRLGIGLRGDLRAGGQPPGGVDAVQDPAEIARIEQGRRAAADEHGVHRRGHHIAGQLQLGEQRVDVALLARLVRGVGVEVAVTAPGRAERDMDIYPETVVPGARSDTVG
jgi:hypothetical protein